MMRAKAEAARLSTLLLSRAESRWLAQAWHTPIAPHDCTGPVVYAASCHLSLHAANALIQESVRAFYTGWYRELVTGLPVVAGGHVSISDRPGLGLELLPGIEQRPDATVRTFRLAGR